MTPANRWATIIRTPSRAMPRASGGAAASWSGASSNVASGRRAHPATAVSASARGLVAATRMVAVDQGDEAGNALLRERAVGDVLAGEGVLVHLRAHVAGIDPVDAEVGLLGGEDVRELLEPGLRGAVPAPSLVPLDRGVGGDVQDAAGAGREQRERLLDERERCDEIGAQDGLEVGGVETGERRHRRRAERARVVDEDVEAAGALGGRNQIAAVLRVGHIAGDGGRAARDGEGGVGGRERLLAAGVDNQVPAAGSELPGECEAEAARGPGDDGGAGGIHGPTVGAGSVRRLGHRAETDRAIGTNPGTLAGVELDHALIAVAVLATAASEIEARYGLASIEGGRHPGWGTANRIVPLGDTYLELIAAGGSRVSSGGGALRWRTAGIERAAAEPSLPFFIEWGPGTPFPGRAAALSVRAEPQKHLAARDLIARAHVDGLDHAGAVRHDLVLHLHRLDDDQHVAGRNGVARGHADGEHRALHRTADDVGGSVRGPLALCDRCAPGAKAGPARDPRGR